MAVFDATRDWFVHVSAGAKRPPSGENWRWEQKLGDWSPLKAEVDLERRLVKARLTKDWCNQVPVASGLAGGRACIDLVHERTDGSYDFVELKVNDQHPVYAAVEILQYGFIWLLSRGELGYSDVSPVLSTKHVRLCVLAPESFYRDPENTGRWTEFAAGLDSRVTALAVAHIRPAEMNFRFEQFRDSEIEEPLRRLLDARFA